MQWGERQKDANLPSHTQLGSYDLTTDVSQSVLAPGHRMWHCDAYFRNGKHMTLSMFPSKDMPAYESVRETLLKAMRGDYSEAFTSSTPQMN